MKSGEAINKCLVIVVLFFLPCSCHKTIPKTYMNKDEKKEVIIKSQILTTSNILWNCTSKVQNVSANFVGVQFLDESHGFAISSEPYLYKTSDKGKTWKSGKVIIPTGSELSSVFFISDQIGWATVVKIGKDVLDEKSNESWILQTSDGGKTWNKKHFENAVLIERVVFFDNQEGWVIGRKRLRREVLTDQIFVLHTGNGGNTWEDISTLIPDNVDDFAVNILPTKQNEALVLSVERKIYKVLLKEKIVTLLDSFTEKDQTYVGHFGIVSNEKLWIVGGADSVEGVWGVLGIKENNSWLKYSTDSYLKTAVFISDDEVFVSGHEIIDKEHSGLEGERQSILWFSSDGGKNWSPVCKEKDIPEIWAFAINGKQQVWGVGPGAVVLIERIQK
jgi:photosystem II stability/assembly factor-like uncharacterized protein